MNALTKYEAAALPMSAEKMRDHVNLIQEVMQAVMKENVHYGIVPGTKKPSLWKPGAEALCVAFHVEPSFQIEDLSGLDFFRYRVRCVGTHQFTGTKLGEGMGACSSLEEKYKWRKAVNVSEFNTFPEARRRLKFGWDRDKKKEYEIRQVRAEADDVDNTILKMACKRAHIAMSLNVLAASDIFAQDIEDLPEHLRDAVVEEGDEASTRTVTQPQAKSAATPARPPDDKSKDTPASDGQIKMIRSKALAAEITEPEILAHFKIETLDGISVLTGNCILEFLKDPAAAKAK